MRIAIYSDIHGNLEALEAVLEDIDGHRVTDKICLGDVVGYGASPEECTRLVMQNASITLAGNHDYAVVDKTDTSNFNHMALWAITWTKQNLSPQCSSFLENLPLIHEQGQLTLVHATPLEPEKWKYLISLDDAVDIFAHYKTPYCFAGHTHSPFIALCEPSGRVQFPQAAKTHVTPVQRCFVNTGSVGQPRDHNAKASYALYDADDKTVSIRRVKYDIPKAQARMRKLNFPEFLIRRIAEGR